VLGGGNMNPIPFIKRATYPLGIPVRPMTRMLQGRSSMVGVEIGTDRGLNAMNMLACLDIDTLYCIDPYEWYKDGDGKYKSMQYAEKEAHRRLDPWQDKVVFIKEYSENALPAIKHGLVDFVYIDGNHSYENVRDDIHNYWPRIKPNGVIGGDDFCIRFPGVCRAVLEFTIREDLVLHGTGKDWWVIHP